MPRIDDKKIFDKILPQSRSVLFDDFSVTGRYNFTKSLRTIAPQS